MILWFKILFTVETLISFYHSYIFFILKPYSGHLFDLMPRPTSILVDWDKIKVIFIKLSCQSVFHHPFLHLRCQVNQGWVYINVSLGVLWIQGILINHTGDREWDKHNKYSIIDHNLVLECSWKRIYKQIMSTYVRNSWDVLQTVDNSAIKSMFN